MNGQPQRQRKSGGDVDPAHPRPQRFRSEIIQPEGGHDQDRVERGHGRSRHAVSPAPPGAHHVYRDEGTQQEQRHHRGAAMHHQQIRNALLPELVAGDILLPIGHKPTGACQEQDRESRVDRKAE